MDIKLEQIAEKVFENNPGRLFTPEQLFAEYVEYYEGFDIEIEPEVLSGRIDDFFEEGSASFEEFPMYTLKLDNLTEEEKDYFYQQSNNIYKKIYEATGSNYLKGKIKSLLNL